MDFSDRGHSAEMVIFQGARRFNPSERIEPRLQAILDAWEKREDTTAPGADVFQRPDTQCFAISYDSHSDAYGPSRKDNWLGESLIREFLYEDGICVINDMAPRLFAVQFKIQAVEDTEYLLVCPYPTESGNIAGVVVVCVNRLLLPLSG